MRSEAERTRNPLPQCSQHQNPGDTMDLGGQQGPAWAAMLWTLASPRL